MKNTQVARLLAYVTGLVNQQLLLLQSESHYEKREAGLASPNA
jgi:hypothetical protein